ncbi:hypothetical protein EC988_005048 [Linderina pennispora]|nr:hypothetical protein EC988_005048 [Linderina pennispora]
MIPPEQLLPSTRTFQTRKDSMIRRIPARYTSPTPLAASGAPLGAGSGTGTILQLDGNLQQPNNGDSDFVVVSPTRLDSRLLPRVEAKSRVPWRKRSLIYAMYHTVQNDDTTPPAAASAATAATAATTTTADEPLYSKSGWF